MSGTGVLDSLLVTEAPKRLAFGTVVGWPDGNSPIGEDDDNIGFSCSPLLINDSSIAPNSSRVLGVTCHNPEL